MNYHTLQKQALRYWCRRCINEEFGLTLEPRHCYYIQYPKACKRCKEVHNIVTDLHFFSRWRLWFAKK